MTTLMMTSTMTTTTTTPTTMSAMMMTTKTTKKTIDNFDIFFYNIIMIIWDALGANQQKYHGVSQLHHVYD
jgi:hypothetical protein